MNTERRESRRTDIELPCQWQACAPSPSIDGLCRLFGLPGFISFHGQLSELDAEFSRALTDIRDPAVLGALRALDAKFDVFEAALHAETEIPPQMAIELSAQGIGFDAAEPLAEGSWLGVHLVLPTTYHMVCAGVVTHCRSNNDAGFRIGAQLSDLDTVSAKRLTRLVIGVR